MNLPEITFLQTAFFCPQFMEKYVVRLFSLI